MKIAPGVNAADWRQLHLDTAQSPDWDRAIGILEQRLCRRFTDVIDLLVVEDEKRALLDRRFGFVIFAIDCLLVKNA